MPGSSHGMLEQFLAEDFIAVDFGVNMDLSDAFTDDFREFSQKMIPVIQKFRPEKPKFQLALQQAVSGVSVVVCRLVT